MKTEELIKNLRQVYINPFSTDFDPRSLLCMAANELERLLDLSNGQTVKRMAPDKQIRHLEEQLRNGAVEACESGQYLDSRIANAKDRKRVWETLGSMNWGLGVAEDIEDMSRFDGRVMQWISEATPLIQNLLERSSLFGGEMLAETCAKCWDSCCADCEHTPEEQDTPDECSEFGRCTSGGKCQVFSQKNMTKGGRK